MEKFPPLPPIKGRFSNFGEFCRKFRNGFWVILRFWGNSAGNFFQILGCYSTYQNFSRKFRTEYRRPNLDPKKHVIQGTIREGGSTSGTGVHRQGHFGLEFGGEGHKITSPELLCPDLSEVPVALIIVWTLLHIYGVNGVHPNL